MTCERARNLALEAVLARLGHFPVKSTEKEAWFLSPLRLETQASFKLSKKLNRWYDHGAGTGGNVIDLVCHVNRSSVREALEWLEGDLPSFSVHRQPIPTKERESTINVTKTQELDHAALMSYLRSRSISPEIARILVKEVHYELKGKPYFAIGLKNRSGGWELRNKYHKNSSSPKDLAHIKNGKDTLVVTEGMFDLLSLLQWNRDLEAECDFLVLNSTAFAERAMAALKGYQSVELYLDNDPSGRQTARNLMANHANCRDRSVLYKDYKDMNQWLMDLTKKAGGQVIQDVFLLPQKQSCFAPVGRKEKKR